MPALSDYEIADSEWLPEKEAIILLELEFYIKIDQKMLRQLGIRGKFSKKKLSDHVYYLYNVGLMRAYFPEFLAVTTPKGYKPMGWFYKHYPDTIPERVKSWLTLGYLPSVYVDFGGKRIRYVEISAFETFRNTKLRQGQWTLPPWKLEKRRQKWQRKKQSPRPENPSTE